MTSKAFFLPLGILLFLLLAGPAAEAQKSRTKKPSGVAEYLDDRGKFTDRLWYGGGVNLGFSGVNYYSYLNVGISPMVGYKIIESVSIGPRVSFQYNYVRGRDVFGNIHKVHPVSYSAGVFARIKVFRSIFAQLEYEYESAEFPILIYSPPFYYLDYDPIQAKVSTIRRNRDNAFIGAGYNSAVNGGFGYEILLLYNVLNSSDSLIPLSMRVGFTYKY